MGKGDRTLGYDEHGSYLQGMETGITVSKELPYVRGTDPTYKEWKHGIASMAKSDFGERTDPTYKEWKRRTRGCGWGRFLAHGSYLQGMETETLIARNTRENRGARILPTRNGNLGIRWKLVA